MVKMQHVLFKTTCKCISPHVVVYFRRFKEVFARNKAMSSLSNTQMYVIDVINKIKIK